jgi:hypothetical protein
MADVKEILGLKGATAKGPGKKPKKLNPANTPDKDKPKKSSKYLIYLLLIKAVSAMYCTC